MDYDTEVTTNMKKLSLFASTTVLTLCCITIASCTPSTAGSKMTEKEKVDFKGGPMPPEARAEMKKRMEAVNAQVPEQAATQK